MKLILLVVSIVLFVIAVIVGLTGGTWSNAEHLFALTDAGLALFAASFLPIP